jgi:hypothetical protein
MGKQAEWIKEATASIAREWKIFQKEMEMSYRKTSGDKTRKIDDLYDKIDQLQTKTAVIREILNEYDYASYSAGMARCPKLDDCRIKMQYVGLSAMIEEVKNETVPRKDFDVLLRQHDVLQAEVDELKLKAIWRKNESAKAEDGNDGLAKKLIELEKPNDELMKKVIDLEKVGGLNVRLLAQRSP